MKSATLAAGHGTSARPLRLGLSVGHPRGATGSLGPFVRRANGKIGFVSTCEVLAPARARIGDHIHQPGPHDAELLTGSSRVGVLAGIARPGAGRRNWVDAAFVAVTPDCMGDNEVAEHGPSHRVHGVATSLQVGDELGFLGRTTGLGSGQVVGLDQDLEIPSDGAEIGFTGVIAAAGTDSNFCGVGDAGALVWRRSDWRAVGLVFAGDVESGVGFILPLAAALAALELDLI